MQPNLPRILLLSDGMFAGGTERQIVELLHGVRCNRRFRIALAVLDHGGELQSQATTLADCVFPLHRRSRFDASTILALLAAIKVMPVELIHTIGWMSGLIGLIAARGVGLPLINGTIRAAPPQLLWRERVTRWCALRSDAIVANSQAGLVAYRLHRQPQARVIRNGMDWQRFMSIAPLPCPQPTICMVGNFSMYKDQPTLIRALPVVLREVPTTQLILVGRDRGTLAESSQLVKALGLSDKVTLVTNTSNPLPIVAGSRICVLASNPVTHGEGIANAIIEYMALGKPVIATEDGGNVEIVHHGQTGFLVPSAAPEALAQRLLELLRDPARAQRMGELGQQVVQREFSSERMVTEYETLYAALIGKQRPYAYA